MPFCEVYALLCEVHVPFCYVQFPPYLAGCLIERHTIPAFLYKMAGFFLLLLQKVEKSVYELWKQLFGLKFDREANFCL